MTESSRQLSIQETTKHSWTNEERKALVVLKDGYNIEWVEVSIIKTDIHLKIDDSIGGRYI